MKQISNPKAKQTNYGPMIFQKSRNIWCGGYMHSSACACLFPCTSHKIVHDLL